jgi:integrase
MRMKKRYRLVRRGERHGTIYCIDTVTRQRTSLNTKDAEEAQRLIDAKNDALRQPMLNLQIAKAYLAGSDSGITTRTWQDALNTIIETKQGETQARWTRAARQKPLDLIRHRVIIETQAEHLLSVLKNGTVSTNVHLRKLHNFCLGMNWLPWPILPKRQWPPVRFKEKRAITLPEHKKILEREPNPARWAYYQLCWHLGGSQGDIARLQAEDIDWQACTVAYGRSKTGTRAVIHFSDEVGDILAALPKTGPLFPDLSRFAASDRATEFKRVCRRASVVGVTLHSYRYAWAERAKKAGMPERFAQQALGHNSAAVHRAYARNAEVIIPPLDEYEKAQAQQKVIAVNFDRRKRMLQDPQALN